MVRCHGYTYLSIMTRGQHILTSVSSGTRLSFVVLVLTNQRAHVMHQLPQRKKRHHLEGQTRLVKCQGKQSICVACTAGISAETNRCCLLYD